MFRAGELHRANEVPLAKIDAYREVNSPALRIEPYLGAYFYRFNTTRPPFDDVRVRRAFALAVDREALVRQVLRGGQQPAYRFTPAGFPGYAPKARLRPGTGEEARQLLADAGYPGGRGLPPVEVLYNTHANHKLVAEALQEMWRRNLGVEVRLRNEEWSTYLNSQDTLNFSLSRSGWIADYLHPHTFLEIFVTNGGNNDTGWSNAEYDALREKSLLAADDAERFALYDRMEQILMDELPILPLYDYTRVTLLDPAVQGYYPTLLDNHPWKHLWLDPGAKPAAGSP
jgi:oligopeptide transport system substrate-binding protein